MLIYIYGKNKMEIFSRVLHLKHVAEIYAMGMSTHTNTHTQTWTHAQEEKSHIKQKA